VPVIGVAKAGWTLDQLRERATTRTRQPSRSSARCSAGRLTRRTTSPSHPSPSPRLSRAWGAAGGGSPRHRHWRMVQPEGNPMKPTSPSTRIPKGLATIRRVVADLVSSFKTPAASATWIRRVTPGLRPSARALLVDAASAKAEADHALGTEW